MPSLPPDSAQPELPPPAGDNGADPALSKLASRPAPKTQGSDVAASLSPTQRLDLDPSDPANGALLLADPAVTSASAVTLVAVAVIGLGLFTGSFWLTLAGSLVATCG